MKKTITEFFANSKSDIKSGKPWRVGWRITILFSYFVAVLAILPVAPEDANSSWSIKIIDFMFAPPNEVGDTLAGIAGSLAFLWIIVTVLLQSEELRAQRKELKLARKEYAKMALAQQKQASLLEQQGAIFLDEQRQRAANAAKQTLAALVEQTSIEFRKGLGPCWKIQEEPQNPDASFIFVGGYDQRFLSCRFKDVPNPWDVIRVAANSTEQFIKEIEQYLNQDRFTSKPEISALQFPGLEFVHELASLRSDLSRADQIMLDTLGINKIIHAEAILRELDIWATA